MLKPLTMWITTKCGKFLKRWEYHTTLPTYLKICMQDKKQQLEPETEQTTGSKLGKKYVKAVYCHPDYLTYMQSTSYKVPSWIETQAGIKIPGRNISTLRYADDTTLMAESEEELKSLSMKVEEESEYCWLKIQTFRKLISWHLVPSLHRETMEIVTDFILWGGASKITAEGDCRHEIKGHLILGRKAMTNLGIILKSRDIAKKILSSQIYDFSSSHVWM